MGLFLILTLSGMEGGGAYFYKLWPNLYECFAEADEI